MTMLVDFYRRSGHPIIIYYDITDTNCSAFMKYNNNSDVWTHTTNYGRSKSFFTLQDGKFVDISDPVLVFEEDDCRQLIAAIFAN